MRISINNNFPNDGTLTVQTDDDVTQTKTNMEEMSFSSKYTSDGSSSTFKIRKVFDVVIDVGYVAIVGHNLFDNGSSITLKLDNVIQTTLVKTASSNNHVIMLTFTEVSSVSQIDIEISKNATADQITITAIAAGQYLQVPGGGEHGGYSRNRFTRNKQTKATLNGDAGPVSVLMRSVARSGVINIKNAPYSFINGSDWNSMLSMAFDEGYLLVQEQDGTESGYSSDSLSSFLAFNIDIPGPKVHNMTRALYDASIRFDAYTGV